MEQVFSTRAVKATSCFARLATSSGRTNAVTKRQRPLRGAAACYFFSSPDSDSVSTVTSFTFPASSSCWNWL